VYDTLKEPYYPWAQNVGNTFFDFFYFCPFFQKKSKKLI